MRNALELAVDFLVGATTAMEKPERARGNHLVRHDRRILIIAVVRVEQIELVVLGGTVSDALAVDHDLERPRPGRHPDLLLETLDTVAHALPAAAASDPFFEVEPFIKGDLDRVLRVLSVQ